MDKESIKIGFIGGGNMSTAIAKGILKCGKFPTSNIWVSGPHLENLVHWKEFGANTTTKNGDVYCQCDIVFLGVKPHILGTAIQNCRSTLIENCEDRSVLFVSMLAGITIAQLQKEISQLSSQCRIIRIMPNTPMTVGEGCCLYTGDNKVKEPDYVLLEEILGGSAVCSKIPEQMMNSLGALVGCGPAFVYIIIEALADGAVKQGVPRDLAQKFAAQMVVGSGKMVLETGKHPGLLKDEVCSPGGSTICGITALERGQLRGTLINALEASTKRNKELGDQ